MNKTKKISLIALYSIMILSTLYCAIKGSLGKTAIGFTYFRYFTTLSNIFNGIVSVILLVYLLKGKDYPKPLKTLNLMATTSVTVTFSLVCVFLAPLQGKMWYMMFLNDLVHLHFLNPILSIVALVIYYKGQDFDLKTRLLSLLPVALYSIVYALNVLLFKTWPDFYFFTFGGHNYLAPVSAVVMYLFSMGLTRIITLLCKSKRK